MVVLLSGDARVKARKGPERPVIPENDRAAILDGLKVVDYVLIDPNDQPSLYADMLTALQPDLYVTDGEDIRFSKIMDTSKQIVLPRSDDNTSTTAIIERITSVGERY